MGKHVLVYGILGGLLIVLLRAIEYRYLVIDHSVEIYGGLVALVFAMLGIWLGLRLTRPAPPVTMERVVVREVLVATPQPFERDAERVAALGLTARELQILELIAAGLSTREIAERVFVSENTVKTHSRHLYEKLGASRRTQAVQRGKELKLLP